MTTKELQEHAGTIGERKTPKVSFWPMRDKWRKFGVYWELWGFDGDPRMVIGKKFAVAPAVLKLVYFVMPDNPELVCQVAVEVEPECEYTPEVEAHRKRLIDENMRMALSRKHQIEAA